MKEKEESRSGQGTKAGNVQSEKKGSSQKEEPKKKTETGKSSK